MNDFCLLCQSVRGADGTCGCARARRLIERADAGQGRLEVKLVADYLREAPTLKVEATIEELRTWAEALNEQRAKLAEAAGTALAVLQDALGTPAKTVLEEQAEGAETELACERAAHGTTTRQLAEARDLARRHKEEGVAAYEALSAERAEHAKTMEGLRICGEAFAEQQRLTAKVQAQLNETRDALVAAVRGEKRETRAGPGVAEGKSSPEGAGEGERSAACPGSAHADPGSRGT